MKQLLKRILLISGIISVLLPIIIGTLWYRYVREQEAFYGNTAAEKKSCEPYGMVASRTNEKITLAWQTKAECSGFLLLGETYTDFSNLPYKVLSDKGDVPSVSHVITILKQDEVKYRYAIIVSAGEWYGIGGNPFEY